MLKISTQDIIRELRHILDEEDGNLLTTPDEVAYFRSIWKQKTTPKPDLIQTIVLEEKILLEVSPPPPPEPIFKRADPPALIIEPPPVKPLIPLRSQPVLNSLEHSFDFVGMRKLFQKISPETPIADQIPSDALAKRMASRWQARKMGGKITLFYYQEPKEHKILLEKITHALDIYFGSARLLSAEIIEQKNEWEALFSLPELKLAVISDATLWQLPKLRSFYKELPREQKRMLGEKPLFLLPDLSLYFKDPQLKRSLWRALCQMLPS